MPISDDLRCLFTATIDSQDGCYSVELPQHEIDRGTVRPGETYRVALLEPVEPATSTPSESAPDAPVRAGQVITVEIEDTGDQGDGIARVGPGYVVIVSDTEVGDRVDVELTEVRDTVGFAEVVGRADERT